MKDKGRPTKYNKEVLEKAREYLENYNQDGDVIPSVEGLSLYINIGRTTIYTWGDDEDKEDFRDTLDAIQIKQKKLLMNKGLTSEFNSAITKLALGNHGMTEKLQQEIGGTGGGPIQTTSVINFIPVSGKGKS